MGCGGLRLLRSAQNMPAKSNSPSPPITIPIIVPVFKVEEVEAGALLLKGEDTVLERLDEPPLYVGVRAWLCTLLKRVVCGADAVAARVGATDDTDPAVFVGDEPPAT
jgi:hypothetical protein